MVTYNTRNGSVTLSNEYFSELIGDALSTCYGVAGTCAHGLKKYINMITKKNDVSNCVKVVGNEESVNIEVHIIVTYGMNIKAIAQSIVNKIKYVVFEATGINVKKVTVKIDGIVE